MPNVTKIKEKKRRLTLDTNLQNIKMNIFLANLIFLFSNGPSSPSFCMSHISLLLTVSE